MQWNLRVHHYLSSSSPRQILSMIVCAWKVISEVADHDLPHHLLKFKGGGSMPRWTDALHLVDVNDNEASSHNLLR